METRNSDDLSVGLITICSVIIISSVFNAITLISSFYMKDINYSTLLISDESILPVHTYIVLSIVFSLIMLTTSSLILMRKKFAIYIYFITAILNLITEFTLGDLTFSTTMLAIIFPFFLAIFLNSQRTLFGFSARLTPTDLEEIQ